MYIVDNKKNHHKSVYSGYYAMHWKQLQMFPMYSIMSGFYLLRGKLPPLPPKTFQVINVLLSIVSILICRIHFGDDSEQLQSCKDMQNLWDKHS